MKKMICFVLLMCFCVNMVACGASNNASAASGKSSASPAASAVSPSAAPTDAAAPSAAPAAPTPAPTPEVPSLQVVVDSLNEEEVAQRTEDDPSIGIFEIGEGANTIIYKLAMSIFEYVILTAQAGVPESVNAYNRLVDSLPGLESSIENALRESLPELNVDIYLMLDEYSDMVVAVVRGGSIVFDLVNGVGTAPTGIKPIVEVGDLPPEIQAQIDEITSALSEAMTPPAA